MITRLKLKETKSLPIIKKKIKRSANYVFLGKSNDSQLFAIINNFSFIMDQKKNTHQEEFDQRINRLRQCIKIK